MIPKPSPVPKYAVKVGDVWQLGKHRLMCGDATNIHHVDTLMAGEKADMVFTDPPYNVDYGASKKNPQGWNGEHKQIKNDKLTDEEWIEFNKGIIKHLQSCKGDIYVWGASGPAGMLQ
jgi:DNA modification methylase